ncbi:hypothetical protein [Nocardia amamiensis]|uniref:hypothetical protein n=1 Tax=Nocardia amamiensis TaxID=404578 RepID=UPI000833C1E9|nr:hypothetical protein [Nocardia amamiensis]
MSTATAQTSRTTSRSLFLGVLRLLGAAFEFLFSKPVVLAGLFVVAAVAQIALLLTVNRAPAETLMPSTAAIAHHDTATAADCVMFCAPITPDESAPPVADTATDRTDVLAVRLVSSVSSLTAPNCWMFCSAADPGWRLDL